MTNKLFIASLILIALTSACNFSLAADVTPPPGSQPSVSQPIQSTAANNGLIYPPVPPNPSDGAAIFAEKCAPCHGATGLGDGPRAAQLPNPVIAIGSSEVARAASPAEWYIAVTEGNLERFMPPFNSLSERQRWDTIAYAFSLSSDADSNAQAAQIYQESCAACHGDSGRGDGPQAGSLSNTPSNLADPANTAGQSAINYFEAISLGVSPDMPAFEEQLSEPERWALSDYIRSLSFAAPTDGQAEAAVGTPSSEPAKPDATPQASATLAVAPGTGTLTGSVVNATNGTPPESLEVALHAFQEMTLVYSDTTKTAADGTYVFENLDMPEGRIFFTSTEFEGMIYRSERGDAIADTTELALPIQIYESTTDAADISVDRLHYFLEFIGNDTLRISELYIASNLGIKTLVAPEEGQPVIEFILPEGAANLQFQEGLPTGRFIETETGFGDLLPVTPGMGGYELLYSYELPYKRKLEFSQQMTLPVRAVLVAIPEDGIKVKGPTLEDGGTREGQDSNFHIYTGTELAAGETLEMVISGKPSQGVSISNSSNTGLLIGIGALGLVLVVAGIWLFRHNQALAQRDTAEDAAAEPNGTSSENSDTVMDAILALDDLYKEGKLPEEAYLQRRTELKSRLQELLDREQGS